MKTYFRSIIEIYEKTFFFLSLSTCSMCIILYYIRSIEKYKIQLKASIQNVNASLHSSKMPLLFQACILMSCIYIILYTFIYFVDYSALLNLFYFRLFNGMYYIFLFIVSNKIISK